MRDYLIFRLNRRWLVADPLTISSESDAVAIAEAEKLIEGCDVVEVWQDNRLVAKIESSEKNL
jgi:hypothetical protein